MSSVSPGDTILAKVRDNKIVNVYSEKWDDIVQFDIICICDNGYLVLVPSSIVLTNEFIISKKDLRAFNIPKQFIDGRAHFLVDTHIFSVRSKIDGAVCERCKEFYPMASANHGPIFICYLCRNYRHR